VKQPKALTKCRRCGCAWELHGVGVHGASTCPTERSCWLGRVLASASNSFSQSEIDLLADMLQRISRGAPAAALVRTKSFAQISRKVQSMRTKIERQKSLRGTAKL